MRVDVFKAACQKTTSERRFGICDDKDKTPAKIKTTDEPSWGATVLNDLSKKINFTAIDNCIDIFGDNGDMDSRCDAMLSYDSNLLFVELKDKRDSWKAEGLAQIEATIIRMLEENAGYYFSFKKRKAIVANSQNQSPYFQEYDTDQREYFKNKYKIRIQFESEIVIK